MGLVMAAHLNAAVVADYLKFNGEFIYNVSKECRLLRKIEDQAAQQIEDAMIHAFP